MTCTHLRLRWRPELLAYLVYFSALMSRLHRIYAPGLSHRERSVRPSREHMQHSTLETKYSDKGSNLNSASNVKDDGVALKEHEGKQAGARIVFHAKRRKMPSVHET